MTDSVIVVSPKDFMYEPSELALIVVDMTRHNEPGGAFARVLRERGADTAYFLSRVEATLPNTQRLITAIRRTGGTIVFTKVLIETDDASDWPAAYRQDVVRLRIAPSTPGMQEYELLPPLRAEPRDLVIGKRSVSAFTHSGLELELRQRGVRHVLFAGSTTNFGVGISAIDAANRGFEVTIVEDACAALSEKSHSTWLTMHALFFASAETDDVLAKLSAAHES